jgi:hypothetical protein
MDDAAVVGDPAEPRDRAVVGAGDPEPAHRQEMVEPVRARGPLRQQPVPPGERADGGQIVGRGVPDRHGWVASQTMPARRFAPSA